MDELGPGPSLELVGVRGVRRSKGLWTDSPSASTIPAAPLLNLCLFFVPFAGVSWLRTSKLKKAMLAQASAPGDVEPSPLS